MGGKFSFFITFYSKQNKSEKRNKLVTQTIHEITRCTASLKVNIEQMKSAILVQVSAQSVVLNMFIFPRKGLNSKGDYALQL